ncbi:gastric triacylglycerol lipase-like isoform X1 [Macrosteles quadrilineatus]|uniref:gastric triacylglycerol lipase-like isoform X1 n=1 Tax=Macrosteles quadrilineatus TaxID=74068 RepID=UPI0023E31E06|nr:gastric triacylglycerol lipase-like isoform X1 [Macrosteles quadrilineatus]
MSRNCLAARSEFSMPNGKESKLDDVVSMVNRWNYNLEPHRVTTADGYVLTVFRIPKKDSSKYPVYLQHGHLSCGAAFLANQRSLVYHLFNNDHDVWVGNARGTQFSQKHQRFDTNSAKYWNFSFHEMGKFDLPAIIQYITHTTGKSKVHYIGHSMGTTMFLVMGSLLPENLVLVDTVTFLAPVAVPKHLTALSSSLKWNIANFATKTLPMIGVSKHGQHTWIAKLKHNICGSDKLYGGLCRVLTGTRKEEEIVVKRVKSETDENSAVEVVHTVVSSSKFDRFAAENVIEYSFHGTSWKTHRHFLQIIKAGRFQEFDYGKDNPNVYDGKTKPFMYKLQNINKRIYLLSGKLDTIARPEDVDWLAVRLNDPWLIKEGFEDFDHTAFNQGRGIDRVLKTVEEIIVASEQDRVPDLPKDFVVRDSNIEYESKEEEEHQIPDKFSFSKLFRRNYDKKVDNGEYKTT